MAKFRVYIKWEEINAALAKQAYERPRKNAATCRPTAAKAQRAGPSAEQMGLVLGWNQVVRGGRFKYNTTPPPNPNPSLQSVTEEPKQPTVTTTRKTARPRKLEPKPTAATKPDAGKPKKKALASLKTAAAKPTTSELLFPTKSSTSLLEEMSDILDRLPLQSRVELSRRLTSIPYPPQVYPSCGLS
jgi:hypothetical protein